MISVSSRAILFLSLHSILVTLSSGFFQPIPSQQQLTHYPSPLSLHRSADGHDNDETKKAHPLSPSKLSRRELTTLLLPAIFLPGTVANAADDGGTAVEESITERAARLSREVAKAQSPTITNRATTTGGDGDVPRRTAYDFTLPVAGEDVPFSQVIGQEYYTTDADGNLVASTSVVSDDPKIKAILVVNIKQDDPIARKDVPEFLALAQKYGKDGFAVVCLPTDQGYYEPDTSAMIRLKLAAEYGYKTSNNYAKLTDKVNVLGTGAHPFMRWIQGECRTPAGLGRIQANFEKFLMDGRTGRPLRRYPRKYEPVLLGADIEAVLKGKPLPPPQGNYMELWREAAVAVETDLYRFQKGLNYFDQ